MVRKANVVIVKKTYDENGVCVSKKVYRAKNIVTDAGDRYYAQRACGETPTNNFTNMVLGNGTQPTWGKASTYSNLGGPIAGSNKAVSSGYPRTNDTDPDNTGGGLDVITWRFAYTKTDFSATGINQAVITIASPTTGSPILTGFNFPTPFDKTSNDTLVIFVNHAVDGV